jgi:hypothetical protein
VHSLSLRFAGAVRSMNETNPIDGVIGVSEL